MGAPENSRAWIAAEVFLAACLTLVPAALGGAPEWTSWLIWALSAAALVSWVLGATRAKRRWSMHPLLLIPAVMAGIALFQLLPLPPAMLAFFSPRQADLRDFALVPLGLERWRPIAVDAPATARAFARLCSLGMAFLVAQQLGRSADVRRRLFMVLAVAGVATAAIGFVHSLADIEGLFGVWHYSGNVPFITTFGNGNHAAAFLLLNGTVALALGVDAQSRDAMVGWGIAAAACGLAVFLTLSRGGIATFVVTWAMVGFFLISRRTGGLRTFAPWIIIGLTVLVAAMFSIEQVSDRMETVTSIEKLHATKLELWPMFARGVAPYWRLGMGVSSFELGFSPLQTVDWTITFTHPETFWAQWAADVGVPLAVLLVGFAVVRFFLLNRALASTKALAERVVFIGLLGLVLHDVFDFALESNGVALPAVICVGLISALEEGRPRNTVQQRSLWLTFIPVSAGLIALAWGLPGFTSAERRLEQSLATEHFDVSRALATRLIDRHPADWVLYADMSRASARSATPTETLAWVNRALSQRPLFILGHVEAARMLVKLGKLEQALGEYRQSWILGEATSRAEGLALAAKLNLWERVLTDDPEVLEIFYRMLRAARRDTQARALLDAAVLFPPNDAITTRAELLLVQHEAELNSPESALAQLDALPDALKGRAEVVSIRVVALKKLGRDQDAVAALVDLLKREPGNVTAAFTLVDLFTTLHRSTEARETLDRLKPFVGTNPQRSALFQREAALWAADKRYPRALDSLHTASRIEPTRADLHYSLADIYERMGSFHSAVDEIRKGRLLDTPEGAKSRDAWIDRLEAVMGVGP